MELIENKKAIFVPKKLQDVGNEYENRLTEAVLSNKVKDVEDLLLHHLDEIDMNKGVKGLPPLLTAAMTNRLEICRLLLEKGNIDVNDESSRWKTTPLRLAVTAGHYKIVKLLLEFGASVVISENKIQANPLLHIAIQSDSSCRLQVVKLLLEKCDPNGRRPGNLDTPIHVAAKQGHLDVFQILVEHGAEIDVRNKYGVTPFYDSILRDNLDITRWYISNGYNIHTADIYGVSPIRVAAIEHNITAIKLLIKAGVSLRHEGPDALKYDGIVDLVCHDENLKCMELLLLEGAKQRVLLHSLDLVQYGITGDLPLDVIKFLLNSHPQHELNSDYINVFFRCHGHLLLLAHLSGLESIPDKCTKIKGTSECKEHLRRLTNAPLKLTDLCRIKIRRHLGFTCTYAITVLPLPTTLKLFLQMDDIKEFQSCAECEENDFVIDFR